MERSHLQAIAIALEKGTEVQLADDVIAGLVRKGVIRIVGKRLRLTEGALRELGPDETQV